MLSCLHFLVGFSANLEFMFLKLISALDRGVQPVPAGGHRRAVGEVRAQELPQGGARGDGDMVSFISVIDDYELFLLLIL